MIENCQIKDGSTWLNYFSLDIDIEEPLTREIISQVEYCLDNYNLAEQYGAAGPLGEHIEVEGRLGVLIDTSAQGRWKIPIETEALLYEAVSRSGNNTTFAQVPTEFTYMFQSSVSQYHFDQFLSTLLVELGLAKSDLTEDEGRKPVTREILLETLDVFLKDEDSTDESSIRVSFDPEGQHVLEAIKSVT